MTNNIKNIVDITSYSESNPYICPSNGTIQISGDISEQMWSYIQLLVNGIAFYQLQANQAGMGIGTVNTIKVNKGDKVCGASGNGGTIKYVRFRYS